MPGQDAQPASAEQKGLTRLMILDTIRAAGRIARTDIAKATRISPATVTAATSDMLAAGLIDEVEGGTATEPGRRGRPRVLLRLRGAAHVIAGLKVARHAVSILLVDFEGNDIVSHTLPLASSRMSAETLAETILSALREACRLGGVPVTGLSGVSVGLAGQVDSERGFVHWSSSLVGRNLALGPLLERHLPCPVFIDNDANLVAKAEQLFGEGRNVRDFLVVTIEHGVGLGIVLNGQLHRGARGCGAEFGHIKVQMGGALCQCGQRGCLEAYVGDYALLRETSIAADGAAPRSVAEVFAAARTGDAVALAALERAGQMFAMGLANLINLFDPQLIILSGAQIAFEHLHSEGVVERIRGGVVQVDAPLPEIRVHHWGDLMWAKGAAAYGIEQVSRRETRDLAGYAG